MWCERKRWKSQHELRDVTKVKVWKSKQRTVNWFLVWIPWSHVCSCLLLLLPLPCISWGRIAQDTSAIIRVLNQIFWWNNSMQKLLKREPKVHLNKDHFDTFPNKWWKLLFEMHRKLVQSMSREIFLANFSPWLLKCSWVAFFFHLASNISFFVVAQSVWICSKRILNPNSWKAQFKAHFFRSPWS